MIKYIGVICLLIVYICIHIYLNNTAQESADKFYNDRINNNKTNPKVYDIMHKHLPYWKHNDWLNNLILLITLIPLFYTNNTDMYFDIVALLLIVNILRDIAINITILPKEKECNLNDRSGVYKSVFGACYDKIFSGHTAFVFLLTLLYNSYSVITNVPLLVLWNIFNAISILIIRSHYTIDVLVSFLVCYTVFTEYMKDHYTFNDIVNIINNN
jgi:hypothetical protein